jgi:hypothetical protein
MTEDTTQSVETNESVDNSKIDSNAEAEVTQPEKQVETQEGESAVADQKVDEAARKKSDEGWRRQRKRIQKLSEQNEKLQRELQARQRQPINPTPPDFGQVAQQPQQPQQNSFIYDPVTGRQIDLGVPYDQIDKMIAGNNQVAPQMQPVQQNHAQLQPQQQAPTAPTFHKETQLQADDCLKRLGSDVEIKLRAVRDLASLNNTMVDAAALAAKPFGMNGIEILYELSKTPDGRNTLADVADHSDSASQTIAMSREIQQWIAAKQAKMKSKAPDIPEPVTDRSAPKVRRETAAEYRERLEREGRGS